MDASPHVLADQVRAKRVAIDNDLELLRQRLKHADPRQIDGQRWARLAAPVLGATAVMWLIMRRRRPLRSLEHLLAAGLEEIYGAEQAILPALEHMQRKASNPDLQQALARHLRETEVQIERLRRVFRSVAMKPKARSTAAGIPLIVAEGESLYKRVRAADLLDAALVSTAQRVEHVEIATYGTLRTYAETLGYTYAAQLLQQTLDEERATDEALTRLAERFINPHAVRTARLA